MNTNKMTVFLATGLSVLVFLFVAPISFAGDYDALEGLDEIKVVFDVRAGKVNSAALQIGLIHQTFKDENIRKVSARPDFVVVFAGGATRLVSSDTKGFSPEEKIHLAEIAATIVAMAKDGIKLEVCMFAANVFGVRPETILPGIKKVPNGWISLLGYQANGYKLVGVY